MGMAVRKKSRYTIRDKADSIPYYGCSGQDRVLAVGAVACLLAIPAHAQQLTYNSSWSFQTSSERSTKLSRVDLELRKKGGFYDSFETNILYDGNTFLTYDCVGSNARSSANDSVNSQDASTSSPSTGSELELSTSALGNSSDAQASAEAQNAVSQESSGANTSEAAVDLTNNTGVLNAGGGTSEQTSSLAQSNEGAVSSSATSGVGCNFYTPQQSAAEAAPQ